MQPILERERVKPQIVYDRVGENSVPKRFRWKVREYRRMGELGFFKGKRVELVKGEIIEMAPMKTPHAMAITLMVEMLTKIFGKGFIVRSQLPLSLNNSNEPEPDLSIVAGSARDFPNTHPGRAELIIEVSDSTLRFDRKEKAELYAENMIEDYWIFNLKQRCLEVYRRPVKDKNLGFVYTEIFVVGENESVSPLAKRKARIKVADILP